MKRTLSSLIVLSASTVVAAGAWETSGSAAVEPRWFVEAPQFAGQLEGVQTSIILEPVLQWEGAERRHQVTFKPFFRYDGRDDERTHIDVREAWWLHVGDGWEVLAGVNRVFWGVTESRHLVDIINQTDAVEDIDDEDKLGQPMVQLSFQRNWGRLDAFLLPGFRERTFPGEKGRLGAPLPIDSRGALYESNAENRHLDAALRWSHFLGNWDLGAHVFHGTSREPLLRLSPTGDRLVPFYQQIDQVGIDVQYTHEAWLWKMEAIGREGQGDAFAATVAGAEYTFYQVGGSGADVGVLVEYLYDNRDETAPITAFDDDVFIGSRLAFNDTQDTSVLAGVIVDRADSSTAAFIEAERRLGQMYKLEFEARWFPAVDADSPMAPLASDSFIVLRLTRFF